MPALNSTKLHDMILCVTFTQLEVLHADSFDMNTEMSVNAPSKTFHQGGRFWSNISSGLFSHPKYPSPLRYGVATLNITAIMSRRTLWI